VAPTLGWGELSTDASERTSIPASTRGVRIISLLQEGSPARNGDYRLCLVGIRYTADSTGSRGRSSPPKMYVAPSITARVCDDLRRVLLSQILVHVAVGGMVQSQRVRSSSRLNLEAGEEEYEAAALSLFCTASCSWRSRLRPLPPSFYQYRGVVLGRHFDR
jgi:hypothetical protein